MPPRTVGTPRRSLTRSGATRFLQREGEGPGGEVRVEVARLYAAIDQEGGGQGSKMAWNEAAALAPIARMGWETFTVRMLQQATGLSYHQVRRILQGYTARGTAYCEFLEKCPAVNGVDATVIDESTGTVVRRHELHFQFDAGRYREWVAGLAVWLEDEGGDDPSPEGSCNGGCNPGCKGSCKGGCNEIPGNEFRVSGDGSGNDELILTIENQEYGPVATFSRSEQSPGSNAGEGDRGRGGSGTPDHGSLCDPGPVANGESKTGHVPLDSISVALNGVSPGGIVCSSLCNPVCNSGYNQGATGVRPSPASSTTGRSSG